MILKILPRPLKSFVLSISSITSAGSALVGLVAKLSDNGTELFGNDYIRKCLSYLSGMSPWCAHQRQMKPSVTMLGIAVCLPGAGRFTKIEDAWGKAVQLMLFQAAWPGAAPVMFNRRVTSHSHQASTAYLLARINIGPTFPDACQMERGERLARTIGQRDELRAESRGVWSLVSGEPTRMDLEFRPGMRLYAGCRLSLCWPRR